MSENSPLYESLDATLSPSARESLNGNNNVHNLPATIGDDMIRASIKSQEEVPQCNSLVRDFDEVGGRCTNWSKIYYSQIYYNNPHFQNFIDNSERQILYQKLDWPHPYYYNDPRSDFMADFYLTNFANEEFFMQQEELRRQQCSRSFCKIGEINNNNMMATVTSKKRSIAMGFGVDDRSVTTKRHCQSSKRVVCNATSTRGRRSRRSRSGVTVHDRNVLCKFIPSKFIEDPYCDENRQTVQSKFTEDSYCNENPTGGFYENSNFICANSNTIRINSGGGGVANDRFIGVVDDLEKGQNTYDSKKEENVDGMKENLDDVKTRANLEDSKMSEDKISISEAGMSETKMNKDNTNEDETNENKMSEAKTSEDIYEFKIEDQSENSKSEDSKAEEDSKSKSEIEENNFSGKNTDNFNAKNEEVDDGFLDKCINEEINDNFLDKCINEKDFTLSACLNANEFIDNLYKQVVTIDWEFFRQHRM